MKEAEVWKDIEGMDGRYAISNLGNVMNTTNGFILKPRPTKTGYLRVHIGPAGNRKDYYIHRLVADAFCKHPDGTDVVNHIDNNPANNRADNLEWVTQRTNVLYAMHQGRVPRFPNAKRVIGIKDGQEMVFRSIHEAADYAGCDHKTLRRWCKTGKKNQHGFVWKAVATA